MLRSRSGVPCVRRPTVGAPLKERKKYLDAQLNTLRGQVLHSGKVVLGPGDRMYGGVILDQA